MKAGWGLMLLLAVACGSEAEDTGTQQAPIGDFGDVCETDSDCAYLSDETILADVDAGLSASVVCSFRAPQYPKPKTYFCTFTCGEVAEPNPSLEQVCADMGGTCVVDDAWNTRKVCVPNP